MRSSFVFLFLLLLTSSCRDETVVDGITFRFDNSISESGQDNFTKGFSKTIKFLDIKLINSIIVDSIAYGYVLEIPVTDTISRQTIADIHALGVLSLMEMSPPPPIHIRLSNNGKVFRELPFNPDAAKVLGKRMESKSLILQMDIETTYAGLEAFELLLRSKFPVLFTSQDTVRVKVYKRQEHVNVDIKANLDSVKTDEIISIFKDLDPLYYLGIVGNVDTYFNVKTNSATKVLVLNKIP